MLRPEDCHQLASLEHRESILLRIHSGNWSYFDIDSYSNFSCTQREEKRNEENWERGGGNIEGITWKAPQETAQSMINVAVRTILKELSYKSQ